VLFYYRPTGEKDGERQRERERERGGEGGREIEIQREQRERKSRGLLCGHAGIARVAAVLLYRGTLGIVSILITLPTMRLAHLSTPPK